MVSPTTITVIGAGSANFGENTLACLLRSRNLKGSTLRLVDRNARSLDIVHRLAKRLNQEWGAGFDISAHTQHGEALEDAQFVISAIEVGPREELWKSDFEIPLKYGLRQPYAENGGPGGFAHAARNIGPVMEIVRDMEQACPGAWFINFTNPMVRICDAISRYSQIKVVGLCHQIYAGYGIVGYLLADYLGIDVPAGHFSTHADPKYGLIQKRINRQAVALVDIKAAGLNHFTWMLDIRRRRTGEDLYPLLAEAWRKAGADIEPLTRRVFEAFGCMPVPGDE